jgi:hypothetical protein
LLSAAHWLKCTTSAGIIRAPGVRNRFEMGDFEADALGQ